MNPTAAVPSGDTTFTLPDTIRDTPKNPAEPAVLAAYSEICKSYHAIDEFRTKLLGFLPLVSIAGILVINDERLGTEGVRKLAGFVCYFAAAFTLALFLYEIRGILRSNDLIERGNELETRLGVKGQFFVCRKAHEERAVRKAHWVFNAKVTASVMYSLVFSAWFFLGLRLSTNMAQAPCGALASALGLALGFGTFKVVDRFIAA